MGGSDLGVAMAEKVTALGRIGEVDELAALYHYLASDDSRYITGQVFQFDGGWSAGISGRLMASFPAG
jgi:3alpha(or 20beta)-hydroxysteroid dehydrogenase